MPKLTYPKVRVAAKEQGRTIAEAAAEELLTKVAVDKQDSAQVAQEWVAQNLS